MQANIQCPNCVGSGEVSYMACNVTQGKGELKTLQCDVCNGRGKITAEKQDWINKGFIARSQRIARGEGIMAACARLKIGPAELSRMEHGRADPRMLFNKVKLH